MIFTDKGLDYFAGGLGLGGGVMLIPLVEPEAVEVVLVTTGFVLVITYYPLMLVAENRMKKRIPSTKKVLDAMFNTVVIESQYLPGFCS